MGFRFRKSIKLLSGVRLNLSKSGVSASVGKPGATVNIGPKGTRTTVGLPGAGLSFSQRTPTTKEIQSDTTPREKMEVVEKLAWVLVAALLVVVIYNTLAKG